MGEFSVPRVGGLGEGALIATLIHQPDKIGRLPQDWLFTNPSITASQMSCSSAKPNALMHITHMLHLAISNEPSSTSLASNTHTEAVAVLIARMLFLLEAVWELLNHSLNL